MNKGENCDLRPHLYFVRYDENETGPFDIHSLRQMWRDGEINDASTFRRTDWSYWVEVEDLRMELEFVPPKEDSAPSPIPPTLLAQSVAAAPTSNNLPVKTIPYKQRVIVKTYHGHEQQATALFRNDSEVMAAQGYYPTSQNFTQGSYSAASFVVAVLLCFVCVGIIAFIYMLIVKPPGVLNVTYEYKQDELAPSVLPLPPLPTIFPGGPRYFLLQEGTVSGPHEVSKLRAMRSAGQISSETPCCLEGSETWVELGKAVS